IVLVHLSHSPRPPSSTLFPYTTLFRSRPWPRLSTAKRQHNHRTRPSGEPHADLLPESKSRTPFARNWPTNLPRWAKPSTSCRSRSEEHTSELQSLRHLVCRLLLEKKKC